MDKEDNKFAIQAFVILVCLLVVMCIIFAANIGNLVKQREQLKNELEFYQEESIREGQIVSVSDTVVYVIDTLKEKVIEVDIYHELIHTAIEVGDIAVYVVNYDYTDADLLGVIKKE